MTAAAAGGVGGSRPPHISIDQNRFSLVDSTGNVKALPPKIMTDANGQQTAATALDVVFVMSNPVSSKLYWGGKEYNPSSIEPPVCFSDNGRAPSSLAQTPQSTTCAACPHNAIGSAVSKFSGAKIKACPDIKKLAAVVPDLGVDGIEFLMQVKPGSFKNWASMINWIKGQRLPDGQPAELYDFVIRMSFESQGVLKFEPVAWVAGNAPLEQQIVNAWGKMAQLDEMVGKTDQPFAGAIAGPQQVVTQALPPPPPAPLPPPMQQYSQPAPFSAPPAAPPPPAQTFQVAAPSSEPADAPKRRRRTKEELAAANAPAAPAPFVSGLSSVPPTGAPVAQPVDEGIPPFLRRTPASVQPVNTPAPAANTGLATPQPMPAGLAAQLDKAFEFPT